ncbi:hypothetical protein AAG906_027943 [Vitis piasezkii]
MPPAEDGAPPSPSQRRYQTRRPPTTLGKARVSGPVEPSEPSQPQLPTIESRIPFGMIPEPPIEGNLDCRARPFHSELCFDRETFRHHLELRDSFHLLQRYHLEHLMTPRDFFYPLVALDFYQFMTTHHARDPIVIHFTIDGRHGILGARHIAKALHIPYEPVSPVDYREWAHLSQSDMVCILSGGTSTRSFLLRKELPPNMFLLDVLLRSNLFPLQHMVQRRRARLKALFRISEGFYFGHHHLIMTALLYFENKVHRKKLQRADAIPLLFPRLLYQILEHLGYPSEPRLERKCICREYSLSKNGLI